MVRAPFELITITIDTRSGEAAGEKWYLAPLRLCGLSLKNAQYLGSQLFYAGKSTWRQS